MSANDIQTTQVFYAKSNKHESIKNLNGFLKIGSGVDSRAYRFSDTQVLVMTERESVATFKAELLQRLNVSEAFWKAHHYNWSGDFEPVYFMLVDYLVDGFSPKDKLPTKYHGRYADDRDVFTYIRNSIREALNNASPYARYSNGDFVLDNSKPIRTYEYGYKSTRALKLVLSRAIKYLPGDEIFNGIKQSFKAISKTVDHNGFRFDIHQGNISYHAPTDRFIIHDPFV